MNLLKSTLFSLSPFHAVYRDYQPHRMHIFPGTNDRHRLLNGGSRGCHIFNNYHTISMLNRTSQKNSLISVILDFFSVGTVTDINPVLLTDRHRCRHSQRNPFICRPKQDIKIKPKMIVNGLRIVLSQLSELSAGAVKPGIHKEWSLSSALCHKVSEFQNLTIDHEFNKFFFVLLHLLSILHPYTKKHCRSLFSS